MSVLAQATVEGTVQLQFADQLVIEKGKDLVRDRVAIILGLELSGPLDKAVAEALREWITQVLDSRVPIVELEPEKQFEVDDFDPDENPFGPAQIRVFPTPQILPTITMPPSTFSHGPDEIDSMDLSPMGPHDTSEAAQA